MLCITKLSVLQPVIIISYLVFRCHLRILDSFGTEAEFNYGAYQGVVPGGKSVWAKADLQLRQIFTMFRKYSPAILSYTILL